MTNVHCMMHHYTKIQEYQIVLLGYIIVAKGIDPEKGRNVFMCACKYRRIGMLKMIIQISKISHN